MKSDVIDGEIDRRYEGSHEAGGEGASLRHPSRPWCCSSG